MRRPPLRAAVLVVALAGLPSPERSAGFAQAGTAAAAEPAGTIAATLDGEARRWVVVAGGFTESGNVVHLTVTGHADPADPAATGAIRLDLAVTLLAGDAAMLFGTGPALVTAQDIHYLPAADAEPYSTTSGGAVSVTLEAFARDGDRLAIAGSFTARLARAARAAGSIALDGRFEARVKRLGS